MQEPNEKAVGSFGNEFIARAVRNWLRWQHGTRLDERVEELHEDGRYEELAAYLQAEYETLYEKEVQKLKTEYRSFRDEETGEFTGPANDPLERDTVDFYPPGRKTGSYSHDTKQSG